MIKKYTCGTKYVLKYERRSTEKGLKKHDKKKMDLSMEWSYKTLEFKLFYYFLFICKRSF